MTRRIEESIGLQVRRASYLRRLACLLERWDMQNAAAELRAIASIFSERALSIKRRKGSK